MHSDAILSKNGRNPRRAFLNTGCFSRDKLDGAKAAGTIEGLRALEVDALLGPKGSDAAADLVWEQRMRFFGGRRAVDL